MDQEDTGEEVVGEQEDGEQEMAQESALGLDQLAAAVSACVVSASTSFISIAASTVAAATIAAAFVGQEEMDQEDTGEEVVGEQEEGEQEMAQESALGLDQLAAATSQAQQLEDGDHYLAALDSEDQAHPSPVDLRDNDVVEALTGSRTSTIAARLRMGMQPTGMRSAAARDELNRLQRLSQQSKHARLQRLKESASPAAPGSPEDGSHSQAAALEPRGEEAAAVITTGSAERADGARSLEDPEVDSSVTSAIRSSLRDALAQSSSRVMNLFRDVDVDGSGEISRNEFGQAILALGFKVSTEEIDKVFGAFDVDHSGQVSFKELNKMLRQRARIDEVLLAGAAGEIITGAQNKHALRAEAGGRKGAAIGKRVQLRQDADAKSQLREILVKNAVRVIDLFRDWDADGNGQIDKLEFSRALKALGYKVEQQDIDALFDSFDPDGSGTVDYRELNQELRRGADARIKASVLSLRRKPKVPLRVPLTKFSKGVSRQAANLKIQLGGFGTREAKPLPPPPPALSGSKRIDAVYKKSYNPGTDYSKYRTKKSCRERIGLLPLNAEREDYLDRRIQETGSAGGEVRPASVPAASAPPALPKAANCDVSIDETRLLRDGIQLLTSISADADDRLVNVDAVGVVAPRVESESGPVVEEILTDASNRGAAKRFDDEDNAFTGAEVLVGMSTGTALSSAAFASHGGGTALSEGAASPPSVHEETAELGEADAEKEAERAALVEAIVLEDRMPLHLRHNRDAVRTVGRDTDAWKWARFDLELEIRRADLGLLTQYEHEPSISSSAALPHVLGEANAFLRNPLPPFRPRAVRSNAKANRIDDAAFNTSITPEDPTSRRNRLHGPALSTPHPPSQARQLRQGAGPRGQRAKEHSSARRQEQ